MASSHPFAAASRPLVFAHRGGSALAPENTIAAFDNGLAVGADGLELDVHLTKDGRVVVCHDDRVDRTTNGSGLVCDSNLRDIQRLDAGYTFSLNGDFPFRGKGLTVPSLADVLGRYAGVRVIIELKGQDPTLATETLEEVRRAKALDRVCFAGACRNLVRIVRKREPRAATSAARSEIRWALYRAHVRWPHGRVPYLSLQVPETAGLLRVVSPQFVRAAHRAGLLVQVWTVDREEDMRRLLAWGVDGLISDRPDIAAQVVAT